MNAQVHEGIGEAGIVSLDQHSSFGVTSVTLHLYTSIPSILRHACVPMSTS